MVCKGETEGFLLCSFLFFKHGGPLSQPKGKKPTCQLLFEAHCAKEWGCLYWMMGIRSPMKDAVFSPTRFLPYLTLKQNELCLEEYAPAPKGKFRSRVGSRRICEYLLLSQTNQAKPQHCQTQRLVAFQQVVLPHMAAPCVWCRDSTGQT